MAAKKGVAIIAVYAFVLKWVILKAINLFENVRVPDELGKMGLDKAEFGEDAYSFDS